jgi:2-polyprenyl-3-methyl-5-hydroxy-6-metoxy-1,4-benzoquinol methylase
VNAGTVQREIRLRREFVQERLGRKAARGELKDLVDFMHGFPAPLERCARCGLLMRNEHDMREAHSYQEDPNDRDLMSHLFPRYLQAFRQKEATYCHLLSPNSDVLEIGSHLGAFLQTAAEWNWNPVALDVGEDTADFARHQGFRVLGNVVEEAPLKRGSLDAVLVWNCFEQLPDPGTMLRACHDLLKRNGLLVIRVPNALFYQVLSSELCGAGEDCFAIQALAYNNLLGFPYLFGYTSAALNRLLAAHAFEPVLTANSELLTMPFPDHTRRIASEQLAISREVASWSAGTTLPSGLLTGPWVELVYRKVPEPVQRRLTMPAQKTDLRFQQRAA